VWNLTGPRLQSAGGLLGSAAAAAHVGMLPTYDAAQHAAGGGAATAGAGAGTAGNPPGGTAGGLLAAVGSGHGAVPGMRAVSPAYVRLPRIV
jgi:hypothetical protein